MSARQIAEVVGTVNTVGSDGYFRLQSLRCEWGEQFPVVDCSGACGLCSWAWRSQRWNLSPSRVLCLPSALTLSQCPSLTHSLSIQNHILFFQLIFSIDNLISFVSLLYDFHDYRKNNHDLFMHQKIVKAALFSG